LETTTCETYFTETRSTIISIIKPRSMTPQREA
jgi:hypothetical protein